MRQLRFEHLDGVGVPAVVHVVQAEERLEVVLGELVLAEHVLRHPRVVERPHRPLDVPRRDDPRVAHQQRAVGPFDPRDLPELRQTPGVEQDADARPGNRTDVGGRTEDR